MNPFAKKNASAMSQGIGSPNPENAPAKVRVLVRTETPRPNIATAPSGSGCVMMPTMVAKKIASSCHALLETPSGTGRNQTITPVAIEARRGFMDAPCHDGACAGAGAGVTEAPAAEALMTVGNLRFGLEAKLDSVGDGMERQRLRRLELEVE